jgi:hypothetical protein
LPEKFDRYTLRGGSFETPLEIRSLQTDKHSPSPSLPFPLFPSLPTPIPPGFLLLCLLLSIVRLTRRERLDNFIKPKKEKRKRAEEAAPTQQTTPELNE